MTSSKDRKRKHSIPSEEEKKEALVDLVKDWSTDELDKAVWWVKQLFLEKKQREDQQRARDKEWEDFQATNPRQIGISTDCFCYCPVGRTNCGHCSRVGLNIVCSICKKLHISTRSCLEATNPKVLNYHHCAPCEAIRSTRPWVGKRMTGGSGDQSQEYISCYFASNMVPLLCTKAHALL